MAILDFFKKNDPVEKTPSDETASNELLGEIAATRSYDLDKSLIDGWNPDAFMQVKDFKIIDEMLTDESIFSILEIRKNYLLSTGYTFTIAENEGKKNQEVLDFVRDNFDSKYTGLFLKDLYQVLSSFEYGFSLSEKVFEKIDSHIYLTRLKTVPPHSINFFTDDLGKLNKIEQKQVSGVVELPIKKMLLYINNDTFDNPYGTSDMKRCYRAWFSKKYILKYWNIYLNRFASPFPVAKVGGQFGTNKVNEMLRILDSIQQKVSLVIPKEADLVLEKANSSSGEYDLAIEKQNLMLSRALLLPDLIGFGASIKGGSLALGQKHFDLLRMSSSAERLKLEEIINEQIIKPLIDINFGKQVVYPKLEFLPFEDEAYIEVLKVFLDSVDRGMPINEGDWNHLRKTLRFPQLDLDEMDDDDNLNPVDVLSDEPLPGQVISKDEDKEDKPVSESPDTSGDTDKKKEYSLKGQETLVVESTPSREPNKYEMRIDFVAEDLQLQKRENATILRLADKFEDIKESLKKDIKRKGFLSDGLKASQIVKLKLKFIGDLESMLRRDTRDVYNMGRKNGKAEIAVLKKEQLFSRVTDTMLRPTEAIDLAEELIDARTFQAVGQLNDKLLNDVKQELINGLETGLSEREIVNRIDNIFNSVTFGSSGNGLAFNPPLLQTIVRTNFNNFYTLGRKQVAENDDYITMYEYSAILDSRVTELCFSLDGKMYRKDDPIWNTISPPNHFQKVLKGTSITTKEGVKKIEDIVVGDLAMTHKGNFKAVYDTMNNWDNTDYYEVELENGKVIYITEEHPVLTTSGWKRTDELLVGDNVVCEEDVFNV